MKIDIRIWNNLPRLRERMRNMTTIILSLSAVNGFYMIDKKSWLMLGINALFFLTTIPVIISYVKWQKEPPKVENDD